MYKQIRKEQINLSALARTIGYTLAHVSRVFGGTRHASIRCAGLMAVAIDITIDELVELLETGVVTVVISEKGEHSGGQTKTGGSGRG